MLTIPNALINEYDRHLKSGSVPLERIAEYKKWLRYFLDYCDKYPVPSSMGERIRQFYEKLKEKKQSDGKARGRACLSAILTSPRAFCRLVDLGPSLFEIRAFELVRYVSLKSPLKSGQGQLKNAG